MTNKVSYELGQRFTSQKFTGAIIWQNTKSIEGVKAWARDQKTGEYVRIYETGPTEWVDGQPQAWSTGNFETVDSATAWATTAYRWINKRRAA